MLSHKNQNIGTTSPNTKYQAQVSVKANQSNNFEQNELQYPKLSVSNCNQILNTKESELGAQNKIYLG